MLQAAAERWGFALSFLAMEWASCEYYSHHGKMMPETGTRNLAVSTPSIWCRRLAGYCSGPDSVVGLLPKFVVKSTSTSTCAGSSLPAFPARWRETAWRHRFLRGQGKHRRRISPPAVE
ncbi:hypothetical protein ACLK1T_25535 [Escherichia coli]